MSFGQVRDAIVASPFGRSLGAIVEAADGDSASVRIPFRDEISNPGRALHGGVMASAIDLAATIAARRDEFATGPVESGCLDLSVDYLSAAIGDDIIARAEVLRRGKELTYCAVDVRNDAGKRIAAGLVTHRFVAGASLVDERQYETHATLLTPQSPQCIRGAELFVSLGFIAHLGMKVQHAKDAQAVLTMAAAGDRGDESGAVHEGALAALIDTTAALASWSIVGLDMRHKASTVGLHINYVRPAHEGVVAHATTRRRNNEIFVNQVEVSEESSRRLVALGTVTYRIVVASGS